MFLLSRFSLVAANKAFYCGAVSAIADTVSVQGVPVPGPNPQTNSKEGQGQPSPLRSAGTQAGGGALPHPAARAPPRRRACGFTPQARLKDETSFKTHFHRSASSKTSYNTCADRKREKKKYDNSTLSGGFVASQ